MRTPLGISTTWPIFRAFTWSPNCSSLRSYARTTLVCVITGCSRALLH